MNKLLQKIECSPHEAVPFDVFKSGVFTCCVLQGKSRADVCARVCAELLARIYHRYLTFFANSININNYRKSRVL